MRGYLKSQDVVVALKLHLLSNSAWTIAEMALSIKLSASETHGALKRLEGASLFDTVHNRIRITALREFVIHGVKYAFPASLGAPTRGLPTAHSAAPLNKEIRSGSSDSYVWPWPAGETRGIAVTPLYRTVPTAAAADPDLHELLALVDGLRVGRAREVELARKELEQRLSA